MVPPRSLIALIASVCLVVTALASPDHTPTHVSHDYYYALPERALFKSYPIYHPDREPAGYLDHLLSLEPERIFDPRELKTDADWIAAGQLVFEMPIDYGSPTISLADSRDSGWYADHSMPVMADGTMPFARYVVREKGKVEVGNLSCAMCHTRVMPDGSAIQGAQGNFPFDHVFAAAIPSIPAPVVPLVFKTLVATPWDAAVTARLGSMSPADFQQALAAVPPGVLVRQGTSLFAPPAIPDLIGLRDRRYLDKTGLGRHRGVAVFAASGCSACHTPPLYTANKLVPADGFTPPADHRTRYDILDVRVGTDPTLTMTTRRGTGYYKIPSLKGVWYRGPFEHSGSVATLDDWFDPRRVRDDYVPTGHRPPGAKTRAVPGHRFGLNLSPSDRAALIAFLRTL